MNKTIKNLLNDLETAFAAFVQAAEALSPEKRRLVGGCGDWSPKDVVAHLVGWDESMKTLIVAPEQFEPPYDVHRFNAQSVASRADKSWDEVCAEMNVNFQELGHALATVTPEQRIYPRIVDWLPGRKADYELHSRQLQTWLI